MKPPADPHHTKPPPCPAPALRPRAHAQAGIARLEFALTVVVLGAIGSFALDHIAQLQGSARRAQLETTAAQLRSATALTQARCAGQNTATASAPGQIPPHPAPRTGVASRVDSPVPSCP